MKGNSLRRREFITLLGGAATAWPLAARAQQSGRTRRVAVLMGVAKVTNAEVSFTTFVQGLQRLGWTAGGNLLIDDRWGDGDMDRIQAQAAELLSQKPDAIMVLGIRALTAMHQQTSTMPIVTVGLPTYYVENFARPSGNVTGFTLSEYSLAGKWVETLKKILPHVATVGFLYQADNASAARYLPVVESAAQSFGLRPVAMLLRDAADIEPAISAFAREPNGALTLPADAFLRTHRELIIGLAAKHRLPAIYPDREFVESRGLMSYGPDRLTLFRQASGYIDRILKGERVTDLPFQAPTKYEFLINLKTAKAFGLEIPPMMLALTDEVIE
jgi:putative ABC transport system substrate-binding protein